MANLFEKPIAARPMSEFVALPLDFIDRSIQRKQQAYNQGQAEVAQVEDVLLKTQALPGDRAKHREILAGYDQQINDIVESAEGDYSQIGGKLDVLKRQMKKDLQYGELYAINQSHRLAMESKADIDKRYADKKVGASGKQLADQAIGQHVTTLQEDGSYKMFTPYAPSNIVDPVAEIQKSVKEIHAKYDEEGTEFVDAGPVVGNVQNKMRSNPEIMKSMMENFRASYPDGTQADFEAYTDNVIQRVVQDRTYNKVTSSMASRKSNQLAPGTTLNDWQQPGRISGVDSGVGRNAAWARGIASGLGATEAFDQWVKSPDGKRTVNYLEQKTGTAFPTDYGDQVDWLESGIDTPRKSSIILGPADPKVMQHAITKDGFLNYGGAVYRKDGTIESADDTREWQGKSEDGNTARILGVVQEGGLYPKGSYVFMGKDGEMRIQEPGDPVTLASEEFNLEQINSAALTNTGKMDITLKGNIPVRGADGSTVDQIPRGQYQAVHDYKSGAIVLYQNGTAKYIKQANGKINKVN